MKKSAMSVAGFAELQSYELEEIQGGKAPKLPIGFTWKDIFMIVADNFDEIKSGLVDGWNFDK